VINVQLKIAVLFVKMVFILLQMLLKIPVKLVLILIVKHAILKHKTPHYKVDAKFVNLVTHYKYQVKHVQVQKRLV